MKKITGMILVLGIMTGFGQIEAQAKKKRFALVISAKDGGPERRPLLYAQRDADSIVSVFRELGGLQANGLVQLQNPTVEDVEEGFQRVSQLATGTEGSEFIFYYSGHSDEQGLILDREKYSYANIKKQADALPIDVKILILDSCNSGAITRLKGGVRIAPMLIRESQTEGYAVMASSSADEASQESARIEGSFFTHFLTSGLRGPADANGDGNVNLREAYDYANNQTVSLPPDQIRVRQHPNFAVNLKGSAEPVLTDIRNRNSGLLIGPAITGSVFIRDMRGYLVLEFQKQTGPIELGLSPGSYSIFVAEGNSYLRGDVSLDKGKTTKIQKTELKQTARRDWYSANEPGGAKTSLYAALPFGPYLDRDRSDLRGANIIFGYGVTRNFSGAAFAVGVQHNKGNLAGVSWALANVTERNTEGVQSGLLNWTGGNTFGIQTGMLNKSDSLDGVQYSAIVNYTKKNSNGLQGALLNVTGQKATGLQLGLLNFGSEVEGAQVGLVNVSKKVDGIPIAPINILLDGGYELAFYNSQGSRFDTALKMRGSIGYSFIAFGTNIDDTVRNTDGGGELAGFGLGLGWEFTPIFGLDTDLGAYVGSDRTGDLFGDKRTKFYRVEYRAQPFLKMGSRYKLFAALTLYQDILNKSTGSEAGDFGVGYNAGLAVTF